MASRPWHEEVRAKSLDGPDSLRHFPHGIGAIVRVGRVTVGRAVLEPGWRWSVDIQPLVGTSSCQLHHLHVLLAGRFAARTDWGEEYEFGPNDVVDLPPGHDAWVIGDEQVVLLDISGNIGDFALATSSTRVLATVLMSDIVDSTAQASRMGDAMWRQRLAGHDRSVRQELERFRGREVKTTGDGFLALFESAEAALHCALAIRESVRQVGLQVRVGVHAGEVEVLGDDVRGIAVHATARLMAIAGPSEVVTSAVTSVLADQAGLAFEERGQHVLKGFDRPLDVRAVVG